MSPAVFHLLPETTLPGLLTRRIWEASELESPYFVLLTANRVYVRNSPIELSESTIRKLLLGGQIEEILGNDVVCHELTQLKRGSLHLENQTVLLNFLKGNLSISFKSSAFADDFFTKLARRVQDRFRPEMAKVDVVRAMRSPLAAMAGILCVMVTISLLANSYADLSEYRFLMSDGTVELPAWYGWVDRFFQTIPPRFIGTLSGAVLALMQLWAYRRLTRQSQILELVPLLDCGTVAQTELAVLETSN
jgi:hypothetical protein